jgi:two-component system, chemotaxis family, protein-glutamate methylesterase/glutaminase
VTSAAGSGATQVLVVDDSAVVRQVLSSILAQAGMHVEVAGDPIIALSKLERFHPHALVVDIEMPRMDGLTFLRRIMTSDRPIPAVVCSSLAEKGTDMALRALEEGAVAVVAKPRLGVKGFLEDSAAQLVDAVRGAAQARVRQRPPSARPRLDISAVLPARVRSLHALTTSKVVAMGASTGGTEAIREILERMPPDAPGIVVVQHMPEIFTAAFARRLSALCRIEVKEAENGERIAPGHALIAPGNRHLAVRRSGSHYLAEIMDGPPVSRHRPSVDVLFRSAAQAAGPNAVGVILTGMGNDGCQGLAEMRKAGAHTIAQDEETSVVFGMPKEAISAGAACEVVALPGIARAILKRVATEGAW